MSIPDQPSATDPSILASPGNGTEIIVSPNEARIVITDTTPLPEIPVFVHNSRTRFILQEITVAAITTFLDHIEKTGLMAEAALRSKLSFATIRRLQRQDSDFANMIDERMSLYKDHLESRLYHRAVIGEKEPIIDKMGKVTGHFRRKDGRSLEFLMKRHIPEFREKQSMDVSVHGGVLVVPASITTAEEWAKTYGARSATEGTPDMADGEVVTPSADGSPAGEVEGASPNIAGASSKELNP